MQTYILKSREYYKIGRTVDLEKRIKAFNTNNPVFEIIHTIPFDCELYLHDKFKDKLFKYEWYLLENEDLAWIESNLELLSQNTPKTYVSEALRAERERSRLMMEGEEKRLEEYIDNNKEQFI